jgi:hypothetical protein
MRRLYKFFFVLFIILFVLSFIYGTAISFGTYQVFNAQAGSGITFGPAPLSAFLKMALPQAAIYSLFMLLFIIFLMRRSMKNGQKFTIRNIIIVIVLFYFVTTVVFGIHLLSFAEARDKSRFLLALGPRYVQPDYIWFPFPVAWLILYLILAAGIKKN